MGISTNIGLRKPTHREQLHGDIKDRIEGGDGKRPSLGAGSIPESDFYAPLLLNYDQIKEVEQKYTVRHMLSPVVKTVRLRGRKVVAAKFYTDAEWGAVWSGSHCGFCDRKYDEGERPEWAVAFSDQLCSCCKNPRGRAALERSPIYFGPVSSIKRRDGAEKDQISGFSGDASVQARQSLRHAQYRDSQVRR